MSALRKELRSLWQRRLALAAISGIVAFGAWLLALPIVQIAARTGLADYPAPEARLFDSSGLLLVELLRAFSLSLGAVRTQLELGGLAIVLLSPLVLAAWCQSEPDEPAASRWSVLSKTLRVYPALLNVFASVWLFRAALLLTGALLAGAIRTFVDGSNDRALDLSAVAVLGCCGAVVSVTPPFRDVASIHAIRENAATLTSLRVGLSVVAADWKPLLARYGLLYAVLACGALLGLLAPRWLSVESGGILGSLAVLLADSVCLAASVVVRASCVEQARRSHHQWRLRHGR